MNVFSSEPFIQSLAVSQLQGQRVEAKDFLVEGRRFHLPVVDGQPLLRWPFMDFFEPTAETAGSAPVLGYLSHGSVDEVLLGVEPPPPLPQGQQYSPTVRWSLFPKWEDFMAHVAARRKNLFPDTQRRERKLAAALGPVTYAYHDDSEEAFDRCRDWKAAQYLATGHSDAFFHQNLSLFRELLARKILVVSTLRAGGTLVAVNWSAEWEGRLYHWVPTYDPAHAAHSPGRLLLHYLLKDSHQRGHRELDMLIGDEGYKWFYCTHARIVRELGRPPLRLTAERVLKARVKKVLERYPAALEAARKLRKRLRS